MNAIAREIKPALPDVIEAEKGLLGAILIANDAYWKVAGFLSADHFSDELLAAIYRTCGTMIAEGRSANPITIKPYLPADQMVGDMTISAFLAHLVAEAAPPIMAYDLGRSIIEMWARHRLIGLAQDMEALARNMPVDMNPTKIISVAADRLTKIAQEGDERAGSLKYGVVLPRAVDRVARESGDQASRIPWFLPEISQAVGDMRRGNLVGVMSDSGGGKTSFSLQQLRFAAGRGFKSAFFSIEISEEEAALQAAAQQSHIALGRLDGYTLNTNEKAGLEKEMMEAADLPLYIIGFGECSLSDIRVKAEAMVKSQGLDLIIIDHAKMIGLPNPKDIFADRINALYRGLKAMAKALNIAIVILIQRNDDWKQRWKGGGSIRPMMGDAYGGSGVKQNLDVWFSLYRPEPLYKELIPLERREEKRDRLIQDYDRSRGKAWIINHKRRRGEPGQTAEIRFEAEYTMFASPMEEAPPAFDFDEGAML